MFKESRLSEPFPKPQCASLSTRREGFTRIELVIVLVSAGITMGFGSLVFSGYFQIFDWEGMVLAGSVSTTCMVMFSGCLLAVSRRRILEEGPPLVKTRVTISTTCMLRTSRCRT